MTEEWRPCVGYIGEYAVSSLGRVMSMDYYRFPHQNRQALGAPKREGRVNQ